MSGREVDLWFSAGSTYTYLTMMRLPAVQEEQGAAFRLRPFNLGKILGEIGHFPFQGEPAKLAYMWRDLERRAAMYGYPAATPIPWPAPQTLLANKVCFIANREGWCLELIRAFYERWFQHGEEPGSDAYLENGLKALGRDAAQIVARAKSDEIELAIDAETSIARDLGLFGSPSFVVNGEVFWGDDRMEDAIFWAKRD